jgi:hypothetical protein
MLFSLRMKNMSCAHCVGLRLSFWLGGQSQKDGALRRFSHFATSFVRHRQQWFAQ